MTETQTTRRHIIAPLAALRDGHEYPGAPINSRSAEKANGIDHLAASIKLEGVLQSLLVCKSEDENFKGMYFVIDGNRRLAALKHLAKAGAFDEAHGVPVLLLEETNPLDALRKSLTANVEHVPLHPVDRYETFTKVHAEQNKTPLEIANMYGVSELVVKRAMALGKLAPEVRVAWRAGNITDAAAQVFTLAKDHKHQADTLKRFKGKLKSADEGDYVLRELKAALVGSEHDIKKAMIFVTRSAYEAAGGKVIEDLFSDEVDVIPRDRELLQKLVDQKIEEKLLALVKSGWGWAEARGKQHENRWSWKRLGKNPTAAEKSNAGCIVSLDYNGKLEIDYGFIKPGTKMPKAAASKKKGKSAPKAEATAISQKLSSSLDEQLTRAMGNSVAENIQVALAALIAGFGSWGHDGCVRVEASGLSSKVGEPEDFNDLFERALKRPQEELLQALAKITGDALRCTAEEESKGALVKALPAETVIRETQKAFAAGEYFDGAAKPIVLQAIRESLGAQQAAMLLNKPKGVIAEFATREVPQTGWLPPELRTPHYKGPSPKGTTKPAPAASSKAKPAKSAKAPKKPAAPKAKPAKKPAGKFNPVNPTKKGNGQ